MATGCVSASPQNLLRDGLPVLYIKVAKHELYILVSLLALLFNRPRTKPLHFSIILLTSSEDRRKMHLSTFITSTVAATASWSNTGEPWAATPTETTTPFRQPLGCDLQQLQSCLPGCAPGALPCQLQCYNLAHCYAPTASKILVTRQVAMDDTSEARPTGCVKQKKTLVTRQVAIDDTPEAKPTGCAQ